MRHHPKQHQSPPRIFLAQQSVRGLKLSTVLALFLTIIVMGVMLIALANSVPAPTDDDGAAKSNPVPPSQMDITRHTRTYTLHSFWRAHMKNQ